MKKIFSIVLFFISAGNCFAQQVTFQKAFGESQYDVIWNVLQTTDSGYIFTGIMTSPVWDGYLVRTNSSGTILWNKTYGGFGTHEHFHCIRSTPGGGYIISGYIENLGCPLVKIDSAGNVTWNKSLNAIISVIEVTSEGGYIMSGRIGKKACLLKTDSLGNVLWYKTYRKLKQLR
jgi:hypothetical protein